jgi:hypothetical protein
MSFALKGADANGFGIFLPNTIFVWALEESYLLKRSCANDSLRMG